MLSFLNAFIRFPWIKEFSNAKHLFKPPANLPEQADMYFFRIAHRLTRPQRPFLCRVQYKRTRSRRRFLSTDIVQTGYVIHTDDTDDSVPDTANTGQLVHNGHFLSNEIAHTGTSGGYSLFPSTQCSLVSTRPSRSSSTSHPIQGSFLSTRTSGGSLTAQSTQG